MVLDTHGAEEAASTGETMEKHSVDSVSHLLLLRD